MNTKIKKYPVLLFSIFVFALFVLSLCFLFSYSNQAFAEDFGGDSNYTPENDSSSSGVSNYTTKNDPSGSTDASKTNPSASQPKTGTGSSDSASFDYTPMEKIPGFDATGDFSTYVLAVYNFGIWTIGLSALLMIMIGGFMYITSAGNNASMEKAKGIITDAIIGVLMALSAYLILYVINPELVKIKTISMSGASSSQNQAECEKWCRDAGGNQSWTSECIAGCGSGTAVRATGTCSDLNDSLKNELNNAGGGVPTALLASFMLRECSPAMSNPSACNKNNLYGAGGAMQFTDGTWYDKRYGCSGSKFNRQDALKCAANKIRLDSGGDYSEAGIRKAAKLYCGSCTDRNACGGNYCDGIIANYNVYKNCPT
ncbi:MAG TPA: hypothetical protein P5262_00175 [Candidatus Moranbacteria bacterium]|nr:hypothetical protein [Candidatus Moranbacteria bacterium]